MPLVYFHFTILKCTIISILVFFHLNILFLMLTLQQIFKYIYIIYNTPLNMYIYMYIHNIHLYFSSPLNYYNKLMLASFTAIQFILLCLLPPIFCIYHLLTSTTFTSFSNSRQMPASFSANYFISFLHYTEITAIIVYCHFIYLLPFTAMDIY